MCNQNLAEKLPMLKILTVPTLAGLKEDGTVDSAATVAPAKYKDLYKEQTKTHAEKLEKFEKDSMMEYLIVICQCTEDMIYELECNTSYEGIKNKYSVVKLLEMIKKICYSYKLQDYSIATIAKSRIIICSTKQKENELISNYLLSTKN